VRFERSYDFKLIGAIMRHEKLYDICADDYQPARGDFEPREDELIWYLLVKEADEILGLIILAPQNYVCAEIHVRFLPQAWGNLSRVAIREAVQWVWNNTPCVRLVAFCPSYSTVAVRFMHRAGFEVYGINEHSWQRDGQIYDQILMGISRPLKNLEHDRV